MATPAASRSTAARLRIGEDLVKHGLVTREQLESALKRRGQIDLPLGSILIQLGHLSVENLLGFLSEKFAIPSINLFKINVEQEVLDIIPLDTIKQYKILPVSISGKILILAMVSPQDYMMISDIEFTIGKKIRPVVVPYFMMEAALHLLSLHYGDGLKGEAVEKITMSASDEPHKPPRIDDLLRYYRRSGASDMLLTAGVPPSVKIGTQVKRLATISLTPKDTESYARQLMSGSEWKAFLEKKEFDTSVTYKDIARFRINFYYQRGSVAIAIRHVVDKLPSLKELRLPDWIKDYALKPQGLILISGPAGHGKSTTLCTMVDIINTHRKCNIVTLEDPIEYLHKHKKSNINQREVGRDTVSFEQGLRAVFRQAPDVIVIGELRDKESFEIALRAARTGHLVLSTMNAANAIAVIRIIINMFPAHQQNLVQMLLSESLLLSLAQRLVPSQDRTKMHLALERFVNSNRVSNLIREGKLHQIRSQMEAGTEEFTSLDVSLAELYKTGRIRFEDGLIHANNPQFYRTLTGVPG